MIIFLPMFFIFINKILEISGKGIVFCIWDER